MPSSRKVEFARRACSPDYAMQCNPTDGNQWPKKSSTSLRSRPTTSRHTHEGIEPQGWDDRWITHLGCRKAMPAFGSGCLKKAQKALGTSDRQKVKRGILSLSIAKTPSQRQFSSFRPPHNFELSGTSDRLICDLILWPSSYSQTIISVCSSVLRP